MGTKNEKINWIRQQYVYNFATRQFVHVILRNTYVLVIRVQERSKPISPCRDNAETCIRVDMSNISNDDEKENSHARNEQ